MAPGPLGVGWGGPGSAERAGPGKAESRAAVLVPVVVAFLSSCRGCYPLVCVIRWLSGEVGLGPPLPPCFPFYPVCALDFFLFPSFWIHSRPLVRGPARGRRGCRPSCPAAWVPFFKKGEETRDGGRAGGRAAAPTREPCSASASSSCQPLPRCEGFHFFLNVRWPFEQTRSVSRDAGRW